MRSCAVLPPSRQQMCAGVCSAQPQKSTSSCVAWPWPGLASTDTSSASTWCPSTSGWSLPSWKRSMSLSLCFCKAASVRSTVFSVEVKKQLYQGLMVVCGCFRCWPSPGDCPPVRLPSSRWSCLTWSTTQSTSPAEEALVRWVEQAQLYTSFI